MPTDVLNSFRRTTSDDGLFKATGGAVVVVVVVVVVDDPVRIFVGLVRFLKNGTVD